MRIFLFIVWREHGRHQGRQLTQFSLLEMLKLFVNKCLITSMTGKKVLFEFNDWPIYNFFINYWLIIVNFKTVFNCVLITTKVCKLNLNVFYSNVIYKYTICYKYY